MGAGLSQQQINSRIRRRLYALRYELEKRNVEAAYSRFELTATTPDASLRVFYKILRASNAEVAGMLQVKVTRHGQDIDIHTDGNYQDIADRIATQMMVTL